MAPAAVSDLADSPSLITDPSVLPPEDAEESLKKLWNLHGHPHSKRFANPELTSIAALVRHNAIARPTQPAFLYPTGDSFTIINWLEFNTLMNSTAAHYAHYFRKEIDAANKSSNQPTVALLGSGNTIDYLITQVALLKLHIRVLLLSNKNAASARHHLLRMCDVVGLITDKSNAATLSLEDRAARTVMELVSLEQLGLDGHFQDADVSGFITDDEWNLQSLIIHSSGSTGMPKPIIHTNRSMCLIARMYRLFPDFVVGNWYLCFPLFHIAGVSIVLSGIPNGLPTTFPPANWPPAPSSILRGWEELEKMGMPADCLHCAPSVIEDLYTYISSTTNDFSSLVNLKILQPGGASLSPTLLSKLIALGVNVKTTYGSTEIGPPMRTIPHTRDNPNCYHVRNMYPVSPHIQMEPLGDGLFECVVYKGFDLAAELWLDDDAPNPYRTNDLFVEDPPNSGFFVLQGRKDDILVHSNGEKTHAAALQMALEESAECIAKVAVFGNGKPCTAAVIEPSKGAYGLSQEELNAKVWVSVCICNEKAAAHSRIDRSMMLILKEGENLPVTPKGNVRRKATLEQYGERIETMYEQYLAGDAETEESAVPEAISGLNYIKASVASICQVSATEISLEKTFYDLGLDSQKAVRLRAKLAKRFWNFPLMFIFEYPTLQKLHAYLTKPEAEYRTSKEQDRLRYIGQLIQKYKGIIEGWKAFHPTERAKEDCEVIYLTGASGALGNALLETFVRDPGVKQVYCAIRSADPAKRLAESLKSRGYADEVWDSGKISAISYDMKDVRLGLSAEMHRQLANEVTTVVHNAWKMDFNQRVEDFEADCLAGTMHLMSFCCSGVKKTFAFMSSVAASMGAAARGRQIHETPISSNPAMALTTGYAQSKFVVENITQHFAKELAVPVHLFRVGQLCGHSILGVWNSTEMWPIMISTGLNHLKAMPLLASTTVNWLPVNICARTISATLSSPPTSSIAEGMNYTVHNLINPCSISWSAFLDTLEQASGQPFERISMRDWVARLEKKVEEGRGDVPGLKLLGFFHDMAVDGGANGEGVEFKTDSVKGARPIDEQMVRLYLERWRVAGDL